MAKVIDGAEPLDSSSDHATQGVDFQAIYRDNYAAVWRFLLHLGIPKDDVSDVAHNAFMVAYRKLPEFEGRSSIRTWLCGISLRVARRFQRSAAVRLEIPEEDVPLDIIPVAESSVEELRQNGKLALAQRLLDSLPTEQREVFVLHELEQMTGPEIAALTGTSIGTVRSRLRRARAAFRQHVAKLKQKGVLDV